MSEETETTGKIDVEAVNASLRACLRKLGLPHGVCKLARRWWRQEHALAGVLAGIGGPLGNAPFTGVPPSFSECLTKVDLGMPRFADQAAVDLWLTERFREVTCWEDEIDAMDSRFTLRQIVDADKLDRLLDAGDASFSVWRRDGLNNVDVTNAPVASPFVSTAITKGDWTDPAHVFRAFGNWCILSNLRAWFDGTIPNQATAAGKHLWRAFDLGAWCLFWSRSMLFWVPRPVVKFDGQTLAYNGSDPPKRTNDGDWATTFEFTSHPRIHCDDGPAIENIVENIFFLEGQLVPAHAVLRPDLITVREVGSQRNEEVRRLLIERMGWSRYLRETGAASIERRRNDRDAQFEELFRQNNAPDAKFVVSDPSTGRKYALAVPRDVTSCQEAQNWISHNLDRRAVHRS